METGPVLVLNQNYEPLNVCNVRRAVVLVGGIVPHEDIAALKAIGVSEIFLPGTSTEDIVKFINANVRER